MQASLAQHQEYETWIGIKHFWGPGGPLQSGHYPLSVVQGSAEDMARRLKQSHISSCKTAIDQHISKIPVNGAILPSMEVSKSIHNPELFRLSFTHCVADIIRARLLPDRVPDVFMTTCSPEQNRLIFEVIRVLRNFIYNSCQDCLTFFVNLLHSPHDLR